jgi:hypothetical protein
VFLGKNDNLRTSTIFNIGPFDVSFENRGQEQSSKIGQATTATTTAPTKKVIMTSMNDVIEN